MSTRRLLPTVPQGRFTHARRVLGSVPLQDLVHTHTPSPIRLFQSICGQMSQVCGPRPQQALPNLLAPKAIIPAGLRLTGQVCVMMSLISVTSALPFPLVSRWPRARLQVHA